MWLPLPWAQADSEQGRKSETGLAATCLSVTEQSQKCEAKRFKYTLFQLLTKTYFIQKKQDLSAPGRRSLHHFRA